MLAFFGLGLPVVASAEIQVDNSGKLQLYGDFRFRLESDFDSQRSNGIARDDRDRARVRLRFGLKAKLNDTLELGARIRSGASESQQSPHITIDDFNGNDTGDSDVNLDKLFAKIKNSNGGWLWLGRNSFPFWKQNELFWDDDVTVAGLAGGLKKGNFVLNVGYAALPVGMKDFSGDLGGVQGVYSHQLGGIPVTAALGYFNFDADSGDSDAATLRSGNGGRDYQIWVLNIQSKFKVASRPLVLGMDYMHNSENYSKTDPNSTTAANTDEKDGYVLSAKYGKVKNFGDWQLGYYYAHIERFAVNASYAQDDWVRFGSAVETDASDFKGHEYRLKYGLGKKMNLVARYYTVESLTSVQNGKRFRVDFNYKF